MPGISEADSGCLHLARHLPHGGIKLAKVLSFNTGPSAGPVEQHSRDQALKKGVLIGKGDEGGLKHLLFTPVEGVPGLCDSERHFLTKTTSMLQEAPQMLIGRYHTKACMGPQSASKGNGPIELSKNLLLCPSGSFAMQLDHRLGLASDRFGTNARWRQASSKVEAPLVQISKQGRGVALMTNTNRGGSRFE